MKVSRYRLVTTDVAHRPGITIMSRRENGCTVYRAFNTGELSRVLSTAFAWRPAAMPIASRNYFRGRGNDRSRGFASLSQILRHDGLAWIPCRPRRLVARSR